MVRNRLVTIVMPSIVFLRAVPATEPPEFALSPVHVDANQLLDHFTARGAKIHRQVTQPLSETKYAVNESGLRSSYKCSMTKSRHLLGRLSSESLKL